MRQLLFNRLNSLAARCSDHFPKLGIALRSWVALRSGEPELRWVRHLVRKGDVALDIGANWGPYAHQLSRAGCRVIAFEPNQDMARRLAHALPNAQVEAVALSDHEGTATLHIPIMQNGQGATGFGSIEGPRGGGGNPLNCRFGSSGSMIINLNASILLKLMLKGMRQQLSKAVWKRSPDASQIY